MNAETMNTGKIIGTRLMETLIIGAVILFGVVQVLKSQTEAMVKAQERLIDKVDQIGSIQSERKVKVNTSYAHTLDDKVHLHNGGSR